MFCLLVPFFIFIIEMARFLDKTKENVKKMKRNWIKEMKKADQIIIPGLSIIFTLIYFGYAVVVYYRI